MIEGIKKRISLLLIFLSIIELLLFFSLEVVWAIIIILFGWFLLCNTVLKEDVKYRYPITFFMFLGLALIHYILPLPLTLLEFKPVTYNLKVPFETFFHQLLFLLTLVITHHFYRRIFIKNPFRTFLQFTSFYKAPSNLIIWMTGMMGLGFSFYYYFVYGGWENYGQQSLWLTLGQFLVMFIWMPVVIPFYKVRNINGILSNKTRVLLILYSVLVIFIAIVSNWRTILFSGIATFVAMYFIGYLHGHYTLRKLLTFKKLLILFLSIFLISGPVMDLALAMLITRQTRYSTNSEDFLQETLRTFQNKKILENLKDEIKTVDNKTYLTNRWDEKYLENFFLNRFVNLKISDNSIYYANQIGYANENMQQVLWDQIISFVPGFIAQILSIESNAANEPIQSSITDNLYSLAIHDSTVKGSGVIGSMPGVGLSLFGFWYLIIIIPIFIIIFAMFDSFALLSNGKVIFSYFFFTIIVIAFNFFNDRHVFNFELKWIFRRYLESIILFLIIFSITRALEKLIKGQIKLT